jgi:adenylate cyclase class 2
VKAPGSSEESEVKIPVADLSPVRRALTQAGALPVSEVHLERNTLFDRPRGILARAGKALRLRRARGRAILTLKGPARWEGKIKRRQELEVEVADPDAFEAILHRLGYAPRFRYEKRREEFGFAGCVVALDETPIGCFVEVEGPPGEIEPAAAGLGLAIEHAVAGSYPSLYQRARKNDPSLPADMRFPESA